MKNILLIGALFFVCMACDRNKPDPHAHAHDYDHDNTEKNIRDRNPNALTPMDQSESEADRTVTQKIRQALMANDSLSTNGKNIKVITINGVVTLRGPVFSAQEKEAIVEAVNSVQGIKNVDNQLEVTNNH